MKSYAGYVCMEPVNGIILSSSEQNRINREFITEKLKGNYFMYISEHTIKKKPIVLISLLKNKEISGVVFVSSFHLPNDIKERKEIYKLTLKNKKKLHFINEDYTFKNKKDIGDLEDTLIFRNNFFTCVTMSLNNRFKVFLDSEWEYI